MGSVISTVGVGVAVTFAVVFLVFGVVFLVFDWAKTQSDKIKIKPIKINVFFITPKFDGTKAETCEV